MKKNFTIVFASLALCFTVIRSTAQTAPPLSALARLPVKEITVFKDGHAFVLHEGSMPTDASGNVLMDALPAPVLGTFWPYAADRNAKLHSVVAGQRRVAVERTALNLRELLEANIGAEVVITEKNLYGEKEILRHTGTVIGIPERSAAEFAATSPANASERLPLKGDLLLLRTDEGVRTVLFDNIRDLVFKSPHKTSVANEEFRNLLTLKLDWNARPAAKTAEVGLVYLQKGIRWIPHYRITLDGNGTATVRLQATLLNEMINLEGVTANLVIGVPTFAFKETTDPIALQQQTTQLSQYFQQGDRAQMLSNAIATQTARMSEYRPPRIEEPAPPSGGLGPDLPEGNKSEDLFIFTIRNLSLKRGERMVVPVAEYTVPYKDVYTLDLPYAPPADVQMRLNSSQQAELARLFNAPKVMHKLRLENKSSYPLTTAPALLVRDNRVLAQGMMTYTAMGASTDLELTQAVDVQVSKSEIETQRLPNALRWRGDNYTRVDLDGTLTLTNYRGQTVALEITRHVLGTLNSASNNGVIQKINVIEDGRYISAGDYPAWWNWYGWPDWWNHLNGIGRVTWKLNLEANKKVELKYSWNYFWR